MRRHITFALLIVLCSSASYAQERFTLVDLGVPANSGGDAYGGVNSAGAVAGAYTIPTGLRAFVHYPGSGFVDIGTLGGGISRANDVNNAGVVVGRSATDSQFTHAFRYSPGTGIQDIHSLVSLGGANSAALGIDDSGNIVGWAETSGGAAHAFYFDAASQTLSDLHSDPAWPPSEAAAYDSDLGDEVVGVYTDSSGRSRGFVYSRRDRTFAAINTLGGADSVVFKRNAARNVGAADVDGEASRAISFDFASGLIDLGTLGGSQSIAFDINVRRTIVGSAKTADEETRAFIYDADGMRDLNDLKTDPDWYLLEAQGINDAGQIAGTGYLNGELRIFLLTPIVDTTAPVLGGTRKFQR